MSLCSSSSPCPSTHPPRQLAPFLSSALSPAGIPFLRNSFIWSTTSLQRKWKLECVWQGDWGHTGNHEIHHLYMLMYSATLTMGIHVQWTTKPYSSKRTEGLHVDLPPVSVPIPEPLVTTTVSFASMDLMVMWADHPVSILPWLVVSLSVMPSSWTVVVAHGWVAFISETE